MSETETLDIDTPLGARKYIEYASTGLMGREITRVKMGDGKWIQFSNMTDMQAVQIARSLYLDIELPAAKGAPKQ